MAFIYWGSFCSRFLSVELHSSGFLSVGFLQDDFDQNLVGRKLFKNLEIVLVLCGMRIVIGDEIKGVETFWNVECSWRIELAERFTEAESENVLCVLNRTMSLVTG